jgi:UDP-N-acetylmuramoyl-tripeptide--D-alanyl-D-alanine ligase
MALMVSHVWQALGTGDWPWPDLGRSPLADVVVDSRLASAGSLFVALPGERTDGHLFVGDAFARGAQMALVQRPVDEPVPTLPVTQPPDAGFPIRLPLCLLVDDALVALQTLARYWRAQHASCRVVGITGSVGKTTTKELIAAVLGQHFETIKSEGNYNNEIGLPLTMLRLHPGVEWAVQEMGMYALGEIAHLASIALPDMGVVTNVGPTHLERLGTVERIAQAKAELVQALLPHGVAVLNGDDERVRAMGALTPAERKLYYGLEPHNDLWADEVETHGLEGLKLRLHFEGQSVYMRLPILGRHSVYGALAAAAVGLSVGLGWDEIIGGLRDEQARVRLLVVPGLGGSTILDDTYNASPDSTTAALNLLAELEGPKVAVLGDMLELGSYEVEGHRLVGRRAAEVVNLLVAVGGRGRLIADEALAVGMPDARVRAVNGNEEAIDVLHELLPEGAIVLVKGSRGMAMEQIVAALARGD